MAMMKSSHGRISVIKIPPKKIQDPCLENMIKCLNLFHGVFVHANGKQINQKKHLKK